MEAVPCPGTIIDIVVEDEDTFYVALPGGYIIKSTHSGFIWGQPVESGLSDINMLAMAENGTVLAGGRNGEVAYSTDGGASFTKINKAIGNGDVQVVADADYQENGIIYAATNASDKGIWRWRIGVSTSWEQIDKSMTTLSTGQRISGLAMGSEGTLYALRLEPASNTSGGMTRSLNPAAMYDYEIEFNFTNTALPAGTRFDPTLVFPNNLPYLKLSRDSEQKDLWAIDTANEIIYRFQDSLATNAPTLTSPADNFRNNVNSITGRSGDIAFSWDKPSKNVTDYELGIYADVACTIRLHLCLVSSTSDTASVIIGPYHSSVPNQYVEYIPGTTYYWRVRSTGPLNSPWSETRSFSIELLVAPVLSLLTPTNGATNVSQMPAFSWSPISGTTGYRFVLADNVGLVSPIIDTTITTTAYAVTNMLELGQTYFWAVKTVTPIESGWLTIANFRVKEKPVEPITALVPSLLSPANGGIGMSQMPAFSWSPISGTTEYRFVLADNVGLASPIVDTTITTTAYAVTNMLELGKTYFWAVKTVTPIESGWSTIANFTVQEKPVEPIAALVPSLLSPANGGIGMSQMPAFSWSPISGTTEYRFVLADNVGLASPIVDTTITTTAYAVTNMLELGKTYFWAVKTVTPIESGWSTIANFTVQEKPVEPPPTVVVKEVPPPVITIPAPLPTQETVILYAPAAPATPIVPAYIWAIIIIEAILGIAVIFLIVKTGR